MAQSRRGVVRILEVQVHPLVEAILRFIQLRKLLPPLKPMAQSRRGVVQMPEAQVHPLVVAILRFIQMDMHLPPLKPMAQSRCHALIEPLALRVAKAYAFE
jgi:L-fucose mutarotase/ribose pyranase (RbsD/FucU family)